MNSVVLKNIVCPGRAPHGWRDIPAQFVFTVVLAVMPGVD